MTVREAASRLEITPALVYKLCREGKLPHRRLGFGRGVIRIGEEDVAAYLESCRVESREETTREETPRAVKYRPRAEYRPKRDWF